jgi:hypothetical protein
VAKLVLNDVANGNALAAAVNVNSARTEAALEKTLSRDGTYPNQMESPLDMNGKAILNVGSMVVNGINIADVADYTQAAATSAAEAAAYATLAEDGFGYYIGAASSAPTVRKDSSALQDGDFYFNTSTNRMMAYANGVWYATETEGATDTALVTYTPAGTGAVATTVQAKLRETISVKDFGAVGDGVADDYDAIMAAINSATYQGTYIGGPYRAGPSIYFPPGIYYIGQTIEIKKRVTLFGDGSGMAYGDAAILKFPEDTIGIIIQAINTTGETTETSSTSGAASLIRGLAFYSLGGTDDTKHAIWMRGRATIENCYIENFPGDGYHIEATAGGGGATEGNANSWRISNGRVNDCGGSGLYVDGADANAGMCDGLDSSSNGGWGIWDTSFLGNTYVGCHTAANTLGGYKTDNANAQNMFIGCYAEGGQPATEVVSPTIIFGGLHGADFSADSTGFVCYGSANGLRAIRTGYEHRNELGSVDVYSKLGYADTNQSVITWGSSDDDYTENAYRIKYNQTAGWWAITHANSDNRNLIRFPGSVANPSIYAPLFENGLYLGTTGALQIVKNGSAAPSTGTWAKGSVVFNSSPDIGKQIGWVCTTAGTPGTWAPFGHSVIEGSATFDPANLVDGAGETTTVTVTGAALGDFAEASFSNNLNGISLTAWVSAADTVSVRFQNESGGTLDLASGTLRARVRKA